MLQYFIFNLPPKPRREKILYLKIISKLEGAQKIENVSLSCENPVCKNIIAYKEDFKFPPVLEKAPVLVLICCYQSLWKKSCRTFSKMKLSDPNVEKVEDCQHYKDFIPSAFVSLVTRTSPIYQCVCILMLPQPLRATMEQKGCRFIFWSMLRAVKHTHSTFTPSCSPHAHSLTLSLS